MGEAFLNKLKTVLRKLGFTDDELHLELTTSGRVGGHIVSEAFRGESQMNRQDRLWADLARQLTKAELAKIVAILTVTPEEIGDEDEPAESPPAPRARAHRATPRKSH